MGRKSKKKRQNRETINDTGPTGKAPAKVPGRSAPSSTQQRIGRIAAIVLGSIFIFAGTLKVGDPWVFLGTLPAYGVPSALRLPVTVIMPTIEVLLGIMLIIGWRTRIAATAAAGVLAVFAGVIAYGWATGTLQECGCFGPLLKRTPPQALAQDAGFMALAVLGIMWAPIDAAPFSRVRFGTLAAVVVASVAIIGGNLWSDTLTLDDLIVASEPTVGSDEPSFESLDLRNRDVFLYLFHPDCQYCVKNGPQLARIAADPELPEVIGITHSVRPGQIKGYLDHAGADIKAYERNPASFAQITGDGAVPQLVFLQHGRVARVWKGDLPGSIELKRAVNAGGSP
jgi:uncharacterized membrane protein YphA (DoxX/SURF4 family)